MRRLPMPAVLLLRTAIYGAIFVGGTTLVALPLERSLPETPLPGPAALTPGNLLLFVGPPRRANADRATDRSLSPAVI